jgi:hypothetical protein
MANTYTLIASNTVSTAVSSITFSSIPATYTDLLLKGSARDSTGGGGAAVVKVQFNGSTANFTGNYIYGTGSTAGSQTDQPRMVGNAPGGSYTANTFSNFEFYVPNYALANYKSVSADIVAENNATATDMNLSAVLWSNTAAITSITLTTDANFVQYSSFYLYGIKSS